jgi:hypothetical protein
MSIAQRDFHNFQQRRTSLSCDNIVPYLNMVRSSFDDLWRDFMSTYIPSHVLFFPFVCVALPVCLNFRFWIY